MVHSDETLGWNCSHVDPDATSVFLTPDPHNQNLFSNRPSIQTFSPSIKEEVKVEAAEKKSEGLCGIKAVLSKFLQSWGISLPFCQRKRLEEEISKSLISLGDDTNVEAQESFHEIIKNKLRSVVESQHESSQVQLGKR